MNTRPMPASILDNFMISWIQARSQPDLSDSLYIEKTQMKVENVIIVIVG